MSYLPIEHHGVIGDLHTAALVGIDGTIDWLCLPYFDSPSLFASILDDRKGGYFRIAAITRQARQRQMYLPDSNILLTRFLTPDGVGEVVDFMPIHAGGAPKKRTDHQVIRLVRGVRGEIPFRMECRPAFDYARKEARLEKTPFGVRFSYRLWNIVRGILDWVCDNWKKKDEGIWEVRGGAQDFTFSKMMCWVALDRAFRLSMKESLPADRDRWLSSRDEIYETIMDRGFSGTKNSFVQTLDSETLDASMRLAPMVKIRVRVRPAHAGHAGRHPARARERQPGSPRRPARRSRRDRKGTGRDLLDVHVLAR